MLTIQLNKLEELIKATPPPNPPQSIMNTISQEAKDAIIEESFLEMRDVYCKPYLLTSFMHRIFYNVDELFQYKKYFTTYHATNAFFSYIFSQAEYFTLQQLSVCKTSGCVAFGETKLIEFIKNKNIRQHFAQHHRLPNA